MEQINFGTGRLYAVPTGGNTPIQFGALQGVSINFSFQQKIAQGRKQFPIGIYRGVGKMTGRAEFAHIDGAVFSRLLFDGGAVSAGAKRVAQGEVATITGNTVTAAQGANFSTSLGVARASNNDVFERVTAAPVGAQYVCNETTGVHTFNTSQNNTAVLLSYVYSSASGTRTDLTNRDQGLAPQFKLVLAETFNGKSMTVVLNACQSNRLKMQFKQDDFMIPEFDFVFCADANGVVGSISLEG